MSEDNPHPGEICDKAIAVLSQYRDEFDAIGVGSDYHALVFGAVISAVLRKPLLIVRPKHFDETQSLIVPVGQFHPDMKVLYVDDWFEYGATLHNVFSYMCQSAIPNIMGTYEGVRGVFHRGSFTRVNGRTEFHRENGDLVWPLV